MLFSRSKGVVGLDIGSSGDQAGRAEGAQGREYQLQRLGVEPLSPEAIVDGSIMDSSLVVDAIHRLNDQTKVKNTNYATSLSGHSVIIKKIQLPAMPPEELAESIQWEAEQYIPFDINDVRLDYVVLVRGRAGPGQHGRPAGRGQAGQGQRLRLGDQPDRQDPGDRRRRRLRGAERLRGQLRPRPAQGRGAGQHGRRGDQHQHPGARPDRLLARHLVRRQPVHRGAAARVQPLLRAGRGA